MQNKFFSIIKKIIGIAKSKTIIAMTLAEVMITLAVVGIISAMVVPALVNSINDKELKTTWIKAYSTIDQATRNMRADNGGTMKGLAYPGCVYNANYSTTTAMLQYASYYNYKSVNVGTTNIKKATDVGIGANIDCGNLTSSLGKMYKVTNGTNAIKKPDGTYDAFINVSGNGIILNDGTFVIYTPGNANCDGTFHKTLGGLCIGGNWASGVYIDVNGVKPPNTWGKDFFLIVVAENGIYPYGVNPVNLQLYSCDSTNYQYCGAKILANPDYIVPY